MTTIEPRRHNKIFSNQSVKDMAAVELADGKEIEGRGQKAEPAGKSHGMDQDIVLRRRPDRKQARHSLKISGSPKAKPVCSVSWRPAEWKCR